MKNLVIVESPAKAKTIEKFLGSDFVVKSSYGHIRDLKKKDMGINKEDGFKPEYEVSPDSKKTVAELRKTMKQVDTVWLATDEDREGEAIAWHLADELGLDVYKTPRITFNEITKTAIQRSIEEPRTVDLSLVNAQQARRIVDRLVGFELSPVLWKKIRYGLSAGRVQSVAVRLIVERERDIEAFVPDVTYKTQAQFDIEGTLLPAKMKKDLPDLEATQAFMLNAQKSKFSVASIEDKPGKRSPRAPFTTSTLQQEAAQKLGFSVKQTMMVAQRLYEAGKITYMRTDSVNLSQDALNAIEKQIKAQFGEDYYQFRKFKTKSEGAQEAHEAIRPTNMTLDSVGGENNEQRLYRLIWARTMACQMAEAQLKRTVIGIDVSESEHDLQAQGQVMVFDGFLKVYRDGDNDDVLLPPLSVGQELNCVELCARESFSRGPARFGEASLVKALEEMGIGRPSTYAPTISTVQDRGYIEKTDREGVERQFTKVCLMDGEIKQTTETEMTGAERNKLFPTDIARIVTDFLVKHFDDVVDFQFTAKLEKEFDEIAMGSADWSAKVDEFYRPFHAKIENAEEIPREEAAQTRELGTDPVSGKPVSVRIGRFGPFVQIGTKDDEEKPKFASLMRGQKMDTISFEDAMELFKLPRVVGEAPESVAFKAIDGTEFGVEAGQEIKANVGRFGPYLQYGTGKYVTLKGFEPLAVTIDEAWPLVVEKLQKDAEKLIARYDEIEILNGRWGPYVSDGDKNVRIPKDTDPLSYSKDDLVKMLKDAPAKKGGRKKAPAKKTAAKKTTTKKATTKKTTAKKTTTRKKAAPKKS